MQLKSYVKNERSKTPTLMPKGINKGNDIDAKTLQKSLPKQASENIMKIIKNHVFLNSKVIQIHISKNNVFRRFNRLRARTENVSKLTSKMR